MPLLIAACPSFEKPWDEYRSQPEFEEALVYVHLGEYARHLVTLWREGRQAELHRAFAVVEQLHVEGDGYVQEAATIGLLEDLQSSAGHDRIDPDVFRPFLGPQSTYWWDALNRFWSGESPRVM